MRVGSKQTSGNLLPERFLFPFSKGTILITRPDKGEIPLLRAAKINHHEQRK